MLDAIREVGADVWVLTETDAAFTPGPDYQAVFSDIPEEPDRRGERWVAIWSRLPHQALETWSDASRSAAANVQAPTGRPLLVVGSVLPWIGSTWRGLPSAGAVAFRAALDAQAGDWARLAAAAPDAELCLLGDMNQDLSTRHFYGSRAARGALGEALDCLGLLALTGDPTDPARQLSNGIRASVDHICGPAGCARWAGATVRAWPDEPWPRADLSDHYGVSVTTVR